LGPNSAFLSELKVIGSLYTASMSAYRVSKYERRVGA
jgi:hypothetical protein